MIADTMLVRRPDGHTREIRAEDLEYYQSKGYVVAEPSPPGPPSPSDDSER